MKQLKVTQPSTTQDYSTLNEYFNEIAKIEILSPEKEAELVRQIKTGDQDALKQLVSANQRYVVSVAKQYQDQGVCLRDLINEGNIALIKAAKRFDETRGYKFISYAIWWIRQAMLKAIKDPSSIVR